MVQIPMEGAETFRRYYTFMQEQVDFQMKRSLFHTKEHCGRVLLFSLLLADREGLSGEEQEILAAAAVFHDTRRQDDGFDVGHGRRGAEYYWEYCLSHSLKFSELCYRIMEYHDRDDKIGEKALSTMGPEKDRAIMLYRIFKDADALDRFRLGPGQGSLDETYLRTESAKDLTGYAKRVVESWEEGLEA